MQYKFEPVRPDDNDLVRILEKNPGTRIVSVVPNRAKHGAYFVLLEASDQTPVYVLRPCLPDEADVQRMMEKYPNGKIVDMCPNGSRPGAYFALVEVPKAADYSPGHMN